MKLFQLLMAIFLSMPTSSTNSGLERNYIIPNFILKIGQGPNSLQGLFMSFSKCYSRFLWVWGGYKLYFSFISIDRTTIERHFTWNHSIHRSTEIQYEILKTSSLSVKGRCSCFPIQGNQLNMAVFFWYLEKVICPVWKVLYTRSLDKSLLTRYQNKRLCLTVHLVYQERCNIAYLKRGRVFFTDWPVVPLLKKTNIFSNPTSLKLSFAPGHGMFHGNRWHPIVHATKKIIKLPCESWNNFKTDRSFTIVAKLFFLRKY